MKKRTVIKAIKALSLGRRTPLTQKVTLTHVAECGRIHELTTIKRKNEDQIHT